MGNVKNMFPIIQLKYTTILILYLMIKYNVII